MNSKSKGLKQNQSTAKMYVLDSCERECLGGSVFNVQPKHNWNSYVKGLANVFCSALWWFWIAAWINSTLIIDVKGWMRAELSIWESVTGGCNNKHTPLPSADITSLALTNMHNTHTHTYIHHTAAAHWAVTCGPKQVHKDRQDVCLSWGFWLVVSFT